MAAVCCITGEHQPDRRFDEAFEIAWKGVKSLPNLVDQTIKTFGQWDIKSSPDLDFVCRHLAINRDRPRLREVEKILTSRLGLQQWQHVVDIALADCDLLDKVFARIPATEAAGDWPAK